MNSNESRTLWISLAAGLVAAFLLYSYSQEKKAEYDQANGTFTNVVVAAVDIKEMQTIDDTMLAVVQKPKNFLEPQVVKDPEQVVGQVAAAPIKKDEQILSTKLLQPGPDTGIALQVAISRRAVALPIDDLHGVAKLIRPGDRVDIFVALDSGRGLAQKREVSLLMEDVVVLATGVNIVNNLPRTFELDSGGKNINQISLTGNTTYNSLTVEATPKEAQDLIYIMSVSPQNIFFTLRNPNDRKAQPRMPASSADSIGGRFASGDTSGASAPPQFVAPPVPGAAVRPGSGVGTPPRGQGAGNR